MMAVFLDSSTSADETIQAIDEIKSVAGKQVFVSGMSAMVTDLKELCEEQEVIYVAIAVILAVPASYGIAKYRFRGRKAMLLTFLVTQMLPVSVLLTPMFIMFKNMHVYNTWVAAVLADATIGIPFSVLILKNYFSSIPKDLEEAAYLDGCNKFTAFIRILIPIAKPGVMVCAIFSFLYAWGDLAYGMTFILDQEKRPITAGIFNFMGQYGTKWSYLTAFAVVTIIPVALIFIFMQKYIVNGITVGAVKS